VQHGPSTFSRRVSEIAGVLLFAVGLIWLVALATHAPTDPVVFLSTRTDGPVANLAGRVGAFLSDISLQLIGYAAYLLPLIAVVIGWYYFWCKTIDAVYTKVLGLVLLMACTTAFLGLALPSAHASGRAFEAGGWIGDQLSGALAASLNPTGSLIVITALLFLSVMLATQISLGRLFSALFAWIERGVSGRLAAVRARREERRKMKRRREVLEKHAKKNGAVAAAPEPAAAPPPVLAADRPSPRVAALVAGPAPEPKAPDERRAAAPRSGWLGGRKEPVIRVTPPAPAAPAPRSDAPSRAPAERKRGGYTLPPTSLLDAPRSEHKIDERELMESARLLEEKCREFAVAGSVVQIHPGPVVTTFEFKPEAGVKYSKVANLADDLSLAMRAESVLIERIPGKSTIGIQIPNQFRETISLRDLLESDTYVHSGSKLTLALGKTIHGEPFMGDLATMPHLLIAGATGTGKSVALNAMLTSILFRATPDDVRLIMIDPKRLELGMYEDIPHLLTKVVVDPKQAANALTWAVREMEERYKTLAAEGVRNIEQYNRNVRNAAGDKSAGTDGETPKPLPYIVVVIDELADLMMVARNEVEDSIARLAQMARAVGIHLLLATQRPSVDVITGLIKANLPARISFRVSSKIDSRTILDGNGAEQLLGCGDMLLLPPASSRLIRLHGPYISEQETARLANFLRKQGAPVYDESILAEEKAQETLEFEKDDLYDEAARLVVSTGQASISYLQRRLRIGFSRAARLVDMMEAEGIVSPSIGGKPREVLVDKGYFEEVDQQLR
jgi:S-DNA-T family DNA segregation ATPase FtsK/SpoIIIE